MHSPERVRCAAALSFWLPGLGQLYLRRWWRGGVLLVASWWLTDAALAAWPPTAMWSCRAPLNPYGWAALTLLALVVWIAAVHDAQRPARRG